VTAAIGLACGTGMYIAATIATAMVLFGLEIMNSFHCCPGKLFIEDKK
jgi:putative Mg2+ transporter-C (MgtC) family protein